MIGETRFTGVMLPDFQEVFVAQQEVWKRRPRLHG